MEYAFECVSHVTQESLTRRTPCAEWNLADLLLHMNDSLAILHEGVTLGFIATGPIADPHDCSADVLVGTFRDRTRQFLEAATAADEDPSITIDDLVLPRETLIAVGILEIAVHSWDVARSVNVPMPIPPTVASALIKLVPILVIEGARQRDFAPPVPVAWPASPSDHLVAFLGRRVAE
ncbi:maleylpyruvate isomerase family mycothiol-dependent enzyme [Nonomuraea sp. KM90]